MADDVNISENNNPKTALVKLSGQIIKTDGSSYDSNFFKCLDLHPDDYSDISYTPKEAASIRSHLLHLSTGASAAIPLICGGTAHCPFAERCPFVRTDNIRRAADPKAKLCTPIGRQCQVEVNLLSQWTRMFIHEYEIDEKSFSQFTMVRLLAECELMLWRLNNNLAKPENAELVVDQVIGVDKEGNVLTRQEVSAFVEAKEKYENKKLKLIKLMVGDPQEQYKRAAALRQRGKEDPSTNAAQLRASLDRLQREAKALDLMVKEVEGNVIDAEALPIEAEEVKDDTLSPEDLLKE